MFRTVTSFCVLLFCLSSVSAVYASARNNSLTFETPTKYGFSTKGKTVTKFDGLLISLRFPTLLGVGFDIFNAQYVEGEVAEQVTIKQEFINVNYQLFKGFFEGQVGAGIGSAEAICNRCSVVYKVGSTNQVFFRGQVNLRSFGVSLRSGFVNGSVIGQKEETADGTVIHPGINVAAQYIAIGLKVGF